MYDDLSRIQDGYGSVAEYYRQRSEGSSSIIDPYEYDYLYGDINDFPDVEEEE
jgi:hypothetical protein